MRTTASRAPSSMAGGHFQQVDMAKEAFTASLPVNNSTEWQFLISPLAQDFQVDTTSVCNAMGSPPKAGVPIHPLLCASL